MYMFYCTYSNAHTILYILHCTVYILHCTYSILQKLFTYSMYIVHTRFCTAGSPVSVYSLHPGGVSTNLGKNIPQILSEQVTSALVAAFSWAAKVTINEQINSSLIYILSFGNGNRLIYLCLISSPNF